MLETVNFGLKLYRKNNHTIKVRTIRYYHLDKWIVLAYAKYWKKKSKKPIKSVLGHSHSFNNICYKLKVSSACFPDKILVCMDVGVCLETIMKTAK